MKPTYRRLPSPATCLALAALFISLGGTGYAVSSLPRDSVGTAQLRDRAVTEDELAGAAVITRKLANGAVTNRKIARQGLTGSRLAPDTLGGVQIDETLLAPVPSALVADRAKVATRATTADRVEQADRAGRAATADVATLARRATRADFADRAGVAGSLAAVDTNVEDATIPEGGGQLISVECDSGLVPVGGGFLQTGDFADSGVISSSAPLTNGWVVLVFDAAPDPGGDMPGEAYAVCVKADGT